MPQRVNLRTSRNVVPPSLVVRVVIADDHRMIREGLRSLLGGSSNVEVVGEAADGNAAVGIAVLMRPDIVIMDVAMPHLDGFEATRRIASQACGVKVIALSMHADRSTVSRMLHAGAAGFVLKECAFEELVAAIRAVTGGQTYLSPRVGGAELPRRKEETGQPPGSACLPPREMVVLQLVAEGCTTKEIALRLGISSRTVDTYRARTRKRLGLRSLAELTRFAVREGITPLGP